MNGGDWKFATSFCRSVAVATKLLGFGDAAEKFQFFFRCRWRRLKKFNYFWFSAAVAEICWQFFSKISLFSRNFRTKKEKMITEIIPLRNYILEERWKLIMSAPNIQTSSICIYVAAAAGGISTNYLRQRQRLSRSAYTCTYSKVLIIYYLYNKW